jgi:hypothetical protein
MTWRKLRAGGLEVSQCILLNERLTYFDIRIIGTS